MKEFSFSTPIVDSLKFEKSDKYVDINDYQVEIKINKSQVYNTNDKEYYYGIKIVISGAEVPFGLEMQISAIFAVELDEGESVQEILEDKGTGILISYARPIIADLTLRSGLAPFNMPFINV